MLMIDPRAALAHSGRDGLHQPEGAFQIDLDHFVELPFVDFEARPEGNIRRGVVHQNVDRPEFVRVVATMFSI